MRFDIITIFPAFFAGPLDYGIVRRAREAGLIEVGMHDLRDFTHDRHRSVDDRPFGGGEGMVLKPEPLFEAVESIVGRRTGQTANEDAGLKPGATQTGATQTMQTSAALPASTAIVLLSASGSCFSRRRRGGWPRWSAWCCCAAATRESTSASPNIWLPTN